jgi:glycosyltransferase involved in cell wall biosynthesis
MERLVFLVEGDPDDIGNFSGIPFYFSQALRARAAARGLEIETVDSSYLLNVEELLRAASLVQAGSAPDAVLPEVPPALRARKLRFSLNAELLSELASGAALVPSLRKYYRGVGDHMDQRLRERLRPGDVLLSQNHLYPYTGGSWPVYYYLDTSLVDFYFHDTFGTVSDRHQLSGVPELYEELERTSLIGCRGVFCFSSAAKRDLRNRYDLPASALSVVGAGVNFDSFPPPPPPREGMPLRLLFVGIDFVRKGGQVLLDAVERLGETRAILTVVTRDKPALNGNVTFLPPCNKGELAMLYRSADVFVFPTRFEPFGIVLCEAMSFGLPVVATRVFAVPEILGRRNATLLVAPDDPVSLAAAIDRLLTEPQLRAVSGQKNYERARRLFQWKHVAERILARCVSRPEGIL